MQFTCFFLFLLWVEIILGESDLDALLEFRKGIQGGPSGTRLSSWKENSLGSDGCPKNWSGVECDDGNVVSITLNGLDLIGNLDFSSLVGLKSLQNLSISNNNLTGTLPPEIGSIKSLAFLDLSRNLFHGPLPIELSNLENLHHLNVSFNSFSGSLSGTVVKMGNLLNVDLSYNSFSGSIDFGAQNYSLKYLNVSHNALSGELFPRPPIPSLKNLEILDISYNNLTGQLPVPIHFIYSLKVLKLANNQLLGSIPEELLRDGSTLLKELDLSNNKLEGHIGNISSMTLEKVNLSSNQLNGSLPPRLSKCRVVDLSYNMLSGNVSIIENWKKYVEFIDLSWNILTGNLQIVKFKFLKLSTIKLSHNLLEGELLFDLTKYPMLHAIDLSLNRLSGSLQPNLFLSQRLTHLNLSGNTFSGGIKIDGLLDSSRTSSLMSLDLSNNLLNGTLPVEIGLMNHLKLLNVRNNSFSGLVPREIGNLHNLIYLDLSHNAFEGNIPDNLPIELNQFNVSYNNLSGIIPDSLRHFPDSSFHPGNQFLRFANEGLSRNYTSALDRKKHVKPATRNIIIAGVVSLVILIILLSILVKRVIRKVEDREKKTNQGNSLSNLFKFQKKNESCSTLDSSQNPSSSLDQTGSSEAGTSDALGRSDQPIQTLKIERSPPQTVGKSSPVGSLLSSPQTNDPTSENPNFLKVCSPDRLAGDLFLFDHSFTFTVDELSRAAAEILGRSCHGTSYRATLDSGNILIIKWLRQGIAKGKKEFSREAKKLGSIRHPNIITLRGYYWGPKEHEKLLISDHVSADCLSLYLCEAEPRRLPILSLNQRLSIAIDVAGCLNYLHNERAIPHGNLKSTNILINAMNMNVFLTDYSFHRIMSPAGTAEQVLNAGALGYRPPEFANSSKPCPSLKSDVYAFGVILLELLSGKSASEIASGNTGMVDLTDWVKLLANENRSLECFDPSIPGLESHEGPPKGLEDMLRVSLKCILPASERPTIKSIFEDLSNIVL